MWECNLESCTTGTYILHATWPIKVSATHAASPRTESAAKIHTLYFCFLFFYEQAKVTCSTFKGALYIYFGIRYLCVWMSLAPLWVPAVRGVFPLRQRPIWLSWHICCSHLMEPRRRHCSLVFVTQTCTHARMHECTSCLMTLCGFRDCFYCL